jgi:predicted permease
MRDLRYAIRVLLKAPAFTIPATLTLALCIGANAAIYTVVDRVLLRSLPYPQPGRLAMVVREYRGNGITEDDTGQAGATWEALIKGAAAKLDFALTAGGFSDGVNLVAGERAEYVKQQRVSAGYFRVLGIAPELGREFDADEDRSNGPAAVILSHALWRRTFNEDRAIVGKAVTVRGEPHTVVGVLPASFPADAPVDLWTPARPSVRGEGGGENYGIIARLRNGVSWAEADALVAASTDAVVRDRYNRDLGHVRIGVVPLKRGQSQDLRQPLMMLWAAVGVVLLIGCVNVAGLLLARGTSRAPEIATRIALGGGRVAIVRQLLAESVVLAVIGGAGGLALGYVSSRMFATLLQDAVGVPGQVGLDARVFAICGVSALVTSVVFGLVPALQASRVNVRETLVESGSHAIAGAARSWPRRAMVVVEVALGVMLLVGAGLLIRTFDYLMNQPAGFDGTHAMTATLSLQDARYRTAEKVNQLFVRTIANMREVPGVQNAAVALTLPYERALNTGGQWIGAKPGAERIQIMNQTYVTPAYFDTLRIPLIRGRVFTDADTAGAAPVIVVNQAFVKRYSPDVDPIGRQMRSGRGAATIVGVVGDIQQKAGWGNFGPIGAVPASYIPASQTTDGFLTMVHTWFSPSWFVRVDGRSAGVALAMQRAVRSVDPLLPFAKFRTLDDVRGEAVAGQRAQAVLLGSLAGLAVLLAAVGLYGLVANAVAERTRELGIRLALGASSRQAIVSAAAPGLLLGTIGVAVGLVIARFAATTMRHVVWGIAVSDPTTFAVAAATVLVVAVVATLVPAWRIARLNPIKALRQG